MFDGLRHSDEARARLLLLLLSVAWGANWPAMKIMLDELTPWAMRVLGLGLGAMSMFALVLLQRRPLRVRRGPTWMHIVVAAMLNVAVFGLFSAFAQLNTLTSRVVIVVYSMPIWATLMAWPIFGERLNRASSLGLMLCITGLTVLVVPVAASGAPLGLLLALGSSLLWAAGTLYLKWAQIEGDPIAVTAWQLFFSVAVMLVCLALFQGDAPVWPRQASTFYALAYHGVLGVGISYFLWFHIVGRLPAATASLGILTSPVVGIASSALIIGERPTVFDMVGFALILSAAACVLLPSARQPAHPPRREPRAR